MPRPPGAAPPWWRRGRRSRTAVLALVAFATFVNIVAYSIAVPVLPDLSRRLSASPSVIGLLFGSFGVTLLTVSMPMGALSDRIGRRAPLVGGLAALAAASVLMAVAWSLPLLFAARLVQGAADAVTWVVGFALLADVYDAGERGRATGVVMAGSGFAFMIGPSLGGWLYELGGAPLPFFALAAMAAIGSLAFLFLDLPVRQVEREPVPVAALVRVPSIASCVAAVVAGSATISMLEPVMSLHLQTLGVSPGRVGAVFGVAAVATSLLHPLYGRLTDRWGGRPLTVVGLALSACALPMVSRAWSFESAVGLYVVQAAAIALVVTPSLAYMAEATSSAGIGSFGVAYGLYNVAWGLGLLGGPSLGGWLFERFGFHALAWGWAPPVVAVAIVLARAQPRTFPDKEPV